jgi:hypothetical protein
MNVERGEKEDVVRENRECTDANDGQDLGEEYMEKRYVLDLLSTQFECAQKIAERLKVSTEEANDCFVAAGGLIVTDEEAVEACAHDSALSTFVRTSGFNLHEEHAQQCKQM